MGSNKLAAGEGISRTTVHCFRDANIQNIEVMVDSRKSPVDIHVSTCKYMYIIE